MALAISRQAFRNHNSFAPSIAFRKSLPHQMGLTTTRHLNTDARGCKSWRKGWDSNPRYGRPHGGFQDRCLKPLGHPSFIDPVIAKTGGGGKSGFRGGASRDRGMTGSWDTLNTGSHDPRWQNARLRPRCKRKQGSKDLRIKGHETGSRVAPYRVTPPNRRCRGEGDSWKLGEFGREGIQGSCDPLILHSAEDQPSTAHHIHLTLCIYSYLPAPHVAAHRSRHPRITGSGDRPITVLTVR